MKWFRFAILIVSFSVAVEAQTYRLGEGSSSSRPEEISVAVKETKKGDPALVPRAKSGKKQVFLTGTVYDPNRGPISGVKITFRSGDNTLLNTTTDDYGHYEIGLLPGRYSIRLDSPGFKRTVLEDFRIVKTESGKIKRDVIMEVAPPVNAPVVISDSPGKP